MTAACRSCGAPIEWALTDGGSRMPIDARPASQPTNLLAWRESSGGLHVRATDTLTDPGAPAHARPAVSHFATCPDATTHRRPR